MCLLVSKQFAVLQEQDWPADVGKLDLCLNLQPAYLDDSITTLLIGLSCEAPEFLGIRSLIRRFNPYCMPFHARLHGISAFQNERGSIIKPRALGSQHSRPYRYVASTYLIAVVHFQTLQLAGDQVRASLRPSNGRMRGQPRTKIIKSVKTPKLILLSESL